MSATHIPQYYSSSFSISQKDPLPQNLILNNDPENTVQALNTEILKLHPKKELILAITSMSCAILGSGGIVAAIYLKAASPILLGCCLGVCALGGVLSFLKYRGFLAKCDRLKERISKDFLVPEFTYLDRIYTDCLLTQEQFKQIKQYLPQDHITNEGMHLKARRERHYRLSGGQISYCSATPFKLELLKTTDNTQKVVAHYSPWIKLLLKIEQFSFQKAEEKNQLGKAIGCLIYGANTFDMEIHKRLNSIYYTQKEQTRYIARRRNNESMQLFQRPEEIEAAFAPPSR